jgi:hypothetical protein
MISFQAMLLCPAKFVSVQPSLCGNGLPTSHPKQLPRVWEAKEGAIWGLEPDWVLPKDRSKHEG